MFGIIKAIVASGCFALASGYPGAGEASGL
jgi:hypothetical protein